MKRGEQDLLYRMEESHLPQVILLDGLWGSGKSLLAPLVSSMAGVGPFRIESRLEAIIHMFSSRRIDDDAFRFLFGNGVLEAAYNSSIGREINLRLRDDSSYFKTLGVREILTRLNSRGTTDDSPSSVRQNQPYFQLTHLLTQSVESAAKVLPGLLNVINIQRNPAFLFAHWENYLRRWEMKRELTLAVDFRGFKVPFFAEHWAEEWCSMTLPDRSALAIARCAAAERKALSRAGFSEYRSVTVYFGALLRSPEASLRMVSQCLERDVSSATMVKAKKLLQGGARKSNKPRPELQGGALDRILKTVKGATSPWVFEEFYSSVQEFQALEASHGE